MNTRSPEVSNTTDLLLQLQGGERNGQLLPVSDAKCLLSSLITDKELAERHRCAIFRGEKGVAFRSYSDHVFVNGVKTSVQWLKEGDVIQLTPELSVIVKQLGTFDKSKKSLPASRQIAPTLEVNPTNLANATPQNKQAAATGSAARQTEVTQPIPTSSAQGTDGLLNSTPPPASSPLLPTTSSPAPQASTPYQPVGRRAESLSDQLSSLVDIAAGSGTPALQPDAPAMPIADAAPATSQAAMASASIQDYLDKALSATTANTTPQAVENSPATPAEQTAKPISADIAAKIRKEEATNSLNRLLGTPQTDSNATADETAASGVVPTLPAPVSTEAAAQPPAQPTQVSASVPPVQPTPSDLTAISDPVANARPLTESTVLPTTDPSAQSSAAPVASNTSQPKSLDFLKSLGIEPAELGLDRPVQPDAASNLPTAPSSPLASSTPAQAPSLPPVNSGTVNTGAVPSAPSQQPSIESLLASVQAGTPVVAQPAAANPAEDRANQEMATAVQRLEEMASEVDSDSALAPAPAPATQKAESVADVLARMQNAGSLDSFNMDGATASDDETDDSATRNNEPHSALESPPNGIAEAQSETIIATDESPEPADDEESSVEDYMSQLLSRMRGGDDEPEEASAPVKKKPAKKIAAEPVVKTQPQETLKPEEFVPQQKAKRIQSFESLREIANSSNRLAIQDHLANQRKVATQTKMQLALISLGFAVVFFALSIFFSTQISVGGILCGITFLVLGAVFTWLYKEERKLDLNLLNEQNSNSAGR